MVRWTPYEKNEAVHLTLMGGMMHSPTHMRQPYGYNYYECLFVGSNTIMMFKRINKMFMKGTTNIFQTCLHQEDDKHVNGIMALFFDEYTCTCISLLRL